MRRTPMIVLAAAAALVLSACGGGSGSGQDDGKVNLRFTWWGSDARHQRTQQVIEAFQKQHPNIVIKGEFKDWNGYWDSLATATAANDAPDIIQMDELYLASYGQRGALLDLGTVGNQLHTTDFDEAALATGKVDGKQYALPVGLTAYSMVVNTDLLAKAGAKLPDDSKWTWDDLKKIGAQVSKSGGGTVSGVQALGFDIGGVNIWARQHGAALYDDSGKVAIPPKVLADYWTYAKSLVDEHVSPPASVSIERASGALDQSGTATNTAAFAPWWNTQLTSLTTASGQKLKLLKLPGEAQAATKGAYYKPSMFWSVSSRSKHPAEAAQFVDFLANSQEAADILQTDRGVPANKTIRTALAGKLTGTDKEAAEYIDAIEVGPAPRVTPNGASNVEAILKRHAEDVLFGRATPDDAAAAFIKELQAEIDAAS